MTVDQLGRAYQAYRRTAGSRSMAALLVANAIPLIGVLFFGWSLITILVIYWLENGIVGFWNVPRILLAQGSVVPTLPPLPDAAALAATGNAHTAADLQAAWQTARDAQLQANAAATPGPAAPPGFGRALGAVRLPSVGRTALAGFFLVHYGIFWFVHGVFVFTLPMFLGSGGNADCIAGQPTFPSGTPGGFPGLETCASGPFGEVLWTNVLIAGIALFISHGASFLFNYIGRAEYLTASPMAQMGAPYARVVVLHLTILFGAFAVAILGAPIAALLLLVGLKTALDLGLHRREHRAADARVPIDTEFGKVVRDS
jgi:Family of unknown function (DUF6498)